jgi:hypothetical protein
MAVLQSFSICDDDGVLAASRDFTYETQNYSSDSTPDDSVIALLHTAALATKPRAAYLEPIENDARFLGMLVTHVGPAIPTFVNGEAAKLCFAGSAAIGQDFALVNKRIAAAACRFWADEIAKRKGPSSRWLEATFSTLETRASRVAEWIRNSQARASFDDGALVDAQRASDQAIAFLTREFSWVHPKISFTEDGVLSVFWQNDLLGAMLVFIGDGKVAYSVKSLGGSYSSNVHEISFEDEAPATLRSAIESLDPPFRLR